MDKDSKSIFKMQEAGSIPEVNQYGLTEEQMQSVRDNIRRYGLSEEDAVANKIRAIKDSETLRHNLWASLGGPYRIAAARLYNRRLTMPVYNAVSNFQDYTNRWTKDVKSNISSYNLNYKPVSFNPNDRIKDWGLINTKKLPRTLTFFNFKTTNRPIEPEQNNINTTEQEDQLPTQRSTLYVNTPKFEINARERAKINAEREHNEAVEQYRKQTNIDIPEWFSLLWKTAPRKNTIGGFSMLQENEEIDPIAKRFLSKLYTDHAERVYEQKYNEYLNQHPIKTGTGIGYDPYIGIQYNPLVQRQGAAHNYAVKQSGYDGSHSIVPYIETDNKFGNVAIAAASMIPLMGASFGTFGTIPKILSDIKFGYDGTKALLSPEGLQKTFNFIKQGRYGRALASGAWDLIDFSLAKQGIKGIKSFGNYAKDIADVAKFNIWNRPNKFRMEYPWQRAQEVLPDIMQTNTGTKPIFNTLIPINQYAPAYKHGGIFKKQMGGLVYKPYLSEQNENKQTSSTTLSYEPEDSDDELFQVEPVKIYNPPTSIVQEHTEEPIQEQKTEELVYTPQSEFTDKEMSVLYEDGTNEEKRKVAIKYLQQNLSLTKEQAAAIVGQWQRESNFKLNAENKEEKAGKNNVVKSSQYGIGIGQWTGSRHDAFVKYINSHGGVANLKTQLDFAISEIKNNPDFLNNLRNASTIEDASAYVYVQYVAAQYKGIKNTDDLYSKVKAISDNYRKKHQQMYGRSSDTFGVGLRNAIDSLNLLG